MNPFSLIGFLVMFIVIPQEIHSIFLKPVLDIINATGSLTCYSDSTLIEGDYHLCAIRFYNYSIYVDTQQNSTVWDGIWFTNTFRRLIKTRNCIDFNDITDIGVSTCDLMPYENVDTMTLCICATDGCNADLDTCLNSVNASQDALLLPTIMSDLTSIIECANTSDSNSTCSLSPDYISSINVSACEDYVKTHSVLCTVMTSDGMNTHQALIEENYESYFTDRLYALKLLRQETTTDTPDQTDTSIYVKYNINNVMNEECGCTQNSSCNYNISTCAPNIRQTEATTSPLTEIDIIMSDFLTTDGITASDSPTTGATAVTYSPTSDGITVSDSSTTGSITVLDSPTTDSIMASDSLTTNNITASDSPTTDGIMVLDSSPIATNTTASFSTIGYIATNLTVVNTTVMLESTPTTYITSVTSSTTENSVPDGTGLSRGAIAGIVAGAVVGGVMIFSVIFLKCANLAKLHPPFDRSTNYRL